jgi:hypothetical protein
MATRILIGIAIVLLTNGALADECYERWKAEIVAMQPGADDAIDKRSNKELSQTDGAKRTRAIKLQALKDAIELRGQSDPRWLRYRETCKR